jgi:hypothetical protein
LPGLHDLYLKYKKRGLVVLSICAQDRYYSNGKILTGKEAIDHINQMYKLTWPTVIDKSFKEVYGWRGEDRILLGPDGKMIAMMDQLDRKNIETTIQKAMAAGV